ncbi:MAG: IS110 family transposase [bacterium]|nr:IS110 family transposase [bacterium]
MSGNQPGIVVGASARKDVRVACAVGAVGGAVGAASFSADAAGCEELLVWMESHGPVAAVGVEGAGSYGAGLARRLAAGGMLVVEVNRPNRQNRRRRGKSDAVDAEAAARAVLSGEAATQPKSGDGPVEAIRMLAAARRSAIKARTQAADQIHGIVVTAPDRMKEHLSGLRGGDLLNACARLRPGSAPDAVTGAAETALRALARRHQALTAEIDALDVDLLRLCERANPALLAAPGVGADTAAALLVAAGDNPDRMRSEASFAALRGASPIEASSGQTVRHRLNRGGNRQANNALWRIAMVRLRCEQRSIDYAERRRAEGKTHREIIRCLKRHIAREIHQLLTNPPAVPRGAGLRHRRQQAGLTIHTTAAAIGANPSRVSELERGLHHNRDLANHYQNWLSQQTT